MEQRKCKTIHYVMPLIYRCCEAHTGTRWGIHPGAIMWEPPTITRFYLVSTIPSLAPEPNRPCMVYTNRTEDQRTGLYGISQEHPHCAPRVRHVSNPGDLCNQTGGKPQLIVIVRINLTGKANSVSSCWR